MPIRRGTCKVSNRRWKYIYILFISKYLNIFTYCLFPKIYINDFVIRTFRGTCSSVEILKGYMLICRNAEGVHGKGKVGNSWYKRMHRCNSNGCFQAQCYRFFNTVFSSHWRGGKILLECCLFSVTDRNVEMPGKNCHFGQNV